MRESITGAQVYDPQSVTCSGAYEWNGTTFSSDTELSSGFFDASNGDVYFGNEGGKK